MDFYTLAEIKDWLGSGVEETGEHDDVLVSLRASMQTFFETQTGRYFGDEVTFTEVLDGEGNRKIWLRNPPKDDLLTTLSHRLEVGDAWTDYLVTDYAVRGRRLYRAGGLIWPVGLQNLRAIYDSGFATATAIPSDVRQAVRELIETNWRNRVTGTPALLSEQTIAIPRTVNATINRYRMMNVARGSSGAEVVT